MWTSYSLPCIFIILFSVVSIQKAAGSNGILKEMNAECNKEGIKVYLVFKKPFEGVAYSFGHYDNKKCRYITGPDSPYSSATNYTFLIPKDECGTIRNDGETGSSSSSSSLNANDAYIENTLLIQQDTSIQEEGDLAQKIRCVWQKTIEKPLVASLPFYDRRNESPKFVPSIQYNDTNANTNTIIGHRRSSNNNNNYNYNANYNPNNYNSNVDSNSNSGRIRSKGSVENVPYNSYRRKWSRSLKNDNDKTPDGNENKNGNSNNRRQETETILALPFQSNSNSNVVISQGLVISTFLMLSFSYLCLP